MYSIVCPFYVHSIESPLYKGLQNNSPSNPDYCPPTHPDVYNETHCCQSDRGSEDGEVYCEIQVDGMCCVDCPDQDGICESYFDEGKSYCLRVISYAVA